MAAARDQAARIVRAGPETAGDEAVQEAADQLRTHLAEETRSRPAETPGAVETEKPDGPAANAADTAAAKPGKRKFVMMGVLGLLALAAIGYGVYFVLVGRFYVSTDNAYVRANNTTLGARVSGHVVAILPADNSIVRAGDVMFRIDDGDYRIAVEAARSKIATQQATIDRIGRQVTALESAVEQTRAQLASSEAAMKRAGLDFDRQQSLSTKGFASRAAFEVSEAARDQSLAAVKSAQAAYEAARDNVEVTKAQQAEARAQLAELQTQLARAERDLGFTSVRAPVDGTFANRLVNTGDMIQAGQRLANLVPLNDVFISSAFVPASP
jgi:membrane fusion protein (multidrug efflux system)